MINRLFVFFCLCAVSGFCALSTAYVANSTDNTVSIIDRTDPTNLSLIQVVPVGTNPRGIAVSSLWKKAYVINTGSQDVTVIDTNDPTNVSLIQTVPLTVAMTSYSPYAIAISPAQDSLYLACNGPPVLLKINPANNQVTHVVDLTMSAAGIAITPEGTIAYVTDIQDDRLAIVDLIAPSVSYVNAPQQPNGVAISPDGMKVYVACSGNALVLIIDTSDPMGAQVIVNVGPNPAGVAVTPDGAQAYITNSGDGTVTIINTNDPTGPQQIITVGSGPTGIAFTPDGKKAYVTNRDDNNVSIIDTADPTNPLSILTVTVGMGPNAVAMCDLPAPPSNTFSSTCTFPTQSPKGVIQYAIGANLDWSAWYSTQMFGPTSFQIYRFDTTVPVTISFNSKNLLAIVGGAQTNYTDTNQGVFLNPKNRYTYRVKAINATSEIYIPFVLTPVIIE